MTTANAANAQGMNTNVTHALHQNPETILTNVRKLADVHAKAGTNLIAGVAQFMIVRAYAFDDNQRWPIERTRDFLKQTLNEQGLKRASVYRYIETAHKLAVMIVKRNGLGGIVSELLQAEDEDKGYKVILKSMQSFTFLPDAQKPIMPWLADAEGRPRYTVDCLRVNLGLEQLDPTKQPGYKAPTAGPVDPNNPAAALGGDGPVTPTVKPNAGKPEGIIARLKTDKALIKRIPSEVIMGAADAIGREKMAERLVKLMNLNEILLLQNAIAIRLKELAEEGKEPEAVNTEAANDPDNTATALPDVSPVEETEETVSPRKRKANGKR